MHPRRLAAYRVDRLQLSLSVRVPLDPMSQPPDIRSIDVRPGSEIAIVQAFARANAHSPGSACSLATLCLRLTPTLEALETRGFLYRTSSDRWYLDIRRYTVRQFRRRLVAFGATVAVIVVFAWFISRAL